VNILTTADGFDLTPEYLQSNPELSKAQERLDAAPNLCGMASSSTEFDRVATIRALALTINGGYVHGLLPLALDVSKFAAQDPNFRQRFGTYPVPKLLACLIDAINRSDSAAIEQAISILSGTKVED